MTEDSDGLFEEISLPDGSKAYKLKKEDAAILSEMISDRKFWDALTKRLSRVSKRATAIIGFFATVALAWPWITDIARNILRSAVK